MSNLLEQLLSDQKLRDHLEEALRYIYSAGFVAGEETVLACADDKADAAYRQGVHDGRKDALLEDQESAARKAASEYFRGFQDGREEFLDEIGERAFEAATKAYADGFRNGLCFEHEDDLK